MITIPIPTRPLSFQSIGAWVNPNEEYQGFFVMPSGSPRYLGLFWFTYLGGQRVHFNSPIPVSPNQVGLLGTTSGGSLTRDADFHVDAGYCSMQETEGGLLFTYGNQDLGRNSINLVRSMGGTARTYLIGDTHGLTMLSVPGWNFGIWYANRNGATDWFILSGPSDDQLVISEVQGGEFRHTAGAKEVPVGQASISTHLSFEFDSGDYAGSSGAMPLRLLDQHIPNGD